MFFWNIPHSFMTFFVSLCAQWGCFLKKMWCFCVLLSGQGFNLYHILAQLMKGLVLCEQSTGCRAWSCSSVGSRKISVSWAVWDFPSHHTPEHAVSRRNRADHGHHCWWVVTRGSVTVFGHGKASAEGYTNREHNCSTLNDVWRNSLHQWRKEISTTQASLCK